MLNKILEEIAIEYIVETDKKCQVQINWQHKIRFIVKYYL